MSRSMWNGALSFGLVSIPVKLVGATRDHRVHMHMLHAADGGRIGTVQRCKTCEKEVTSADLVKGFEYQDGKHVTFTGDELENANAGDAIEIVAFVDPSEIPVRFYEKPYYLEPQPAGRHPYAVLRQALEDTGRVGIARVYLKSNEHIAAVLPQGTALVVATLRFADSLVDPASLDVPEASEGPTRQEKKAAKALIEQFSGTFDPSEYRDEYTAHVLSMVEAKAAARPQPSPRGLKKAAPQSNVVSLAELLEQSAKKRAASR